MKQKVLISAEAANKILKKNNLPQLATLREITTGLTNPVVVINEEFVIRVDTATNPQDLNNFKKEAFLYSVLVKHSVPVPKLITFDESKTILPYDFLLLSYIKGETLTEEFQKQDDEGKEALAYQLGEIAHTIHSIHPNEFSEKQDLLRKEKSWQDTVIEEFTQYFTLVKEKEYLPEEILEKITDVFQKFKMIRLDTKDEYLVHGDFSSSNIQVRNGKIVGFFDFEFATLGDPLYDLQKLPIHFQLGKGFKTDAFLKGYGKNRFSTHENIRFHMYCLTQGLWEIWATATQRFPFGEKQILEGKDLIIKTLQMGNI